MSSSWHHPSNSNRHRGRWSLLGHFYSCVPTAVTWLPKICSDLSSFTLRSDLLPGLIIVSSRFFTCHGIWTTKESRGEGGIGRMWRWLWSKALLNLHRKISDQKHNEGSLDMVENKDKTNGIGMEEELKNGWNRDWQARVLCNTCCCLWPPIPFRSLLRSGNSKSGSGSHCVWDQLYPYKHPYSKTLVSLIHTPPTLSIYSCPSSKQRLIQLQNLMVFTGTSF